MFIAFRSMEKFSRIYLILVLCIVTTVSGEDSLDSAVTQNYCPYFKNRAPVPQPGLKNCTWYKKNACCLQSELDLIFPSVSPPLGASERCLRYTNFLMCYVCAPDQNLFYDNERLTVCGGFCDKWFAACGDAKFKGMKIKELFKSGKEFCRARKFSVGEATGKDCFSFEQKITSSATPRLPSEHALWLAATMVVLFVDRS